MRTISAEIKSYRTLKPFVIARGQKTSAEQIEVTIREGSHCGRGACVPYKRYGETLDSVMSEITDIKQALAAGLDRDELQEKMPAGAARNAVDCALWDLESAQTGKSVCELADLLSPAPKVTAITVSVGTPNEVLSAARAVATAPLIKLKLGGDGADNQRFDAALRGAPNSKFILDGNEALTIEQLDSLLAQGPIEKIALIEQPFAADHDDPLDSHAHHNILCADESFHTIETIDTVAKRYGVINIKLDKTGGLTEAIAIQRHAKQHGLKTMIGCMLGSSLAMAPAFLLAADAHWIDLDGPLLLAEDDEPAFQYENYAMHPSPLWGAGKK